MDRLRDILRRIDGRGYKAYQEIAGAWRTPELELHVERPQRDPFAPPTRLRLRVGWQRAGFEETLVGNAARRTACEDYLARAFRSAIARHGGESAPRAGSGGSGRIAIEAGGQEVLERTAVRIEPGSWIEARFTVGLPASGRRILGGEAAPLLTELVPRIARDALFAGALDLGALRTHVDVVEDQRMLRRQLAEHDLVAFVGDGSLLPRRSGVDDRPLVRADDAGRQDPVLFESPPEGRVTLRAPHRGVVTGMGVRAGVTLVIGGGFHGKSTLLSAIARGVYDHVPGDGREGVVTDAAAVSIRAEDGRSVEKTDISPFINDLPFGRDTKRFRTANASGSTSQAANIVEALEVGARLLLLDEDTSATNFMIRDARMQALVPKSGEPITPFIDRVRALHAEHGVSTILVMGGSGDYFDVADTVILMDAYRPRDVTARARQVARDDPRTRAVEGDDRFGPIVARRPRVEKRGARLWGAREDKISARGGHHIRWDDQTIDLSAVAGLVDAGQTRAVALALRLLADEVAAGHATLAAALDALEARIDRRGLDVVAGSRARGDLARPRRFEIAAALNRLRTLAVEG